MLKTYFCELVLGFSLSLDQTTAVQFYGLSISVIIRMENLWKFVLWLAITGHLEKGSGHVYPKAYKTQTKTQNYTKLGENM